MKFLSDILARAGLTVDGVVTFNNTATGQTPATNDNSTKLATTAFIKNQSYLTANQTITVSGDATGSGTTSIALTLANSGVTAGTYGNASNIPTITVDSKGRITSISTNAVSIITTLAGLSDVTLTSPSANQVLQYNGTRWINGPAPTTYTLPIASATVLGGIKVGSGLSIDSGTGVLSVTGGGAASIKSTQTFIATAGQTVFTITNGYTAGLIDVFLNGVYLSPNQTTATNGTNITLSDAALAGDIIDVIIASPFYQGAITTTDQLSEGTTNLYFTNARARAAISLTTTGTSGAATYSGGTLNIPQYQSVLTNPITGTGTSGQVAYFNGTSSLTSSAAFTWNNAHGILYVTGTGNGYVSLSKGTASNTGFIDFYNSAGVRAGYIGYSTAANTIDYNANFHVFNANYNTNNPLISLNQTFAGGLSYMPFVQALAPNITNGSILTVISGGKATSVNNNIVISYSHISDGSTSNRGSLGVAGSGNIFNWFASGNVALNTTTDAGFRLDVNGTARVKGAGTTSATSSFTVLNSANTTILNVRDDDAVLVGRIIPDRIVFVGGTQTISVNGTGNVTNFYGNSGALGQRIVSQTGQSIHIAPSTTGGQTLVIEGVGSAPSINSSSILQVNSTTQGFLPPRMTAAQRTAIASPAEGLIVVQTDGTQGLYMYINATWRTLAMV